MSQLFDDFEELLTNHRHYIAFPFDDATPIPIPVQQEPWGPSLISACVEHANQNTSGVLKEENVVGIHPFFKQFGIPRDMLPNEILTLEKVLKESSSMRFGKVLIDSYPDYALMSHFLVSMGLIDLVIFSVEGDGKFIHQADGEKFSGTRHNYAGGSYGYRCVSTAMRAIRRGIPDHRIVPIRDAIVYIDIVPPLLRIPDFFRTMFSGVYSRELLQS